MENDYGGIRQDLGKVLTVTERLEINLSKHEESDNYKFELHNTRLNWLEKMMWLALGGISVIGLGGLSDLIKSFLVK